jgi:hypothetical protein
VICVEEIERPFRDQHDRASVQSHGGLGNLNDLDDVDRFASVHFEYAPHGRELLQLSCIQVALVTFRGQHGEDASPLRVAHRSGTNGIE